VGTCSKGETIVLRVNIVIKISFAMTILRHRFLNILFVTCLGGAILSHGAWAEETKNPVTDPAKAWSFGADVYLWAAGVGGETSGGSDIDVPFSDLIENLDLGFMGVGHVYYNKWHASLDALYLNLSAENGKDITLPNDQTLSGRANVDLKSLVLTPVIGYVALETERFQLEPFAGARYANLDATLDIRVHDRSREFSDSTGLLDGIVGARGDVSIDENWHLPYYVDIGTGDSDLTWQVMAGVGYRINQAIDVGVTYRYIEWQFEDNALLKDLNFSGPLIGARFRF
jgi:opacity protein-like surface antigen